MKDPINTKGISLERLMAIHKFSRRGSLIAAAGQNESRSTLYTKQINQLENYFDLKLTKNEGTNLQLTEEGQALANATADFFQCVIDLQRRGKQQPQTYHIAAGESLIQWIVIPGLSSLPQSSGVNFRLTNLQNSKIVRGLMDRSIDFGLLRKESLKKNLKSIRLGSVHYVLCVPKLMMTKHKIKKNDWESAFRKLPIALHLEHTFVQSALEDVLVSNGIEPNIRLRFDTFPSARVALRSGKYATLMIQFPGVRATTEDYVRIPLPCLENIFRDVYLAWRPQMMRRRADAERVKHALIDKLTWSRDD